MCSLPAPKVPINHKGDFIINSSNAKDLDQFNRLKLQSKEHWHKFTIKNGATMDKEKVLQTILNSVYPTDLVAVKYTKKDNDAEFLARNCSQVIQKLCQTSLKLHVEDDLKPIVLEIHVCFMPIEDFKVNMQHLLKKAIEKRQIESNEGCINLSFFHNDPELSEVLFCPLSQPRFLHYVLCILNQCMSPKSINLSNNNLKILKSLECLKEFPELTSLDLSNNQVEDIENLNFISSPNHLLKEINLNENPICAKFENGSSYVKAILEKIPSLCKLDGIDLSETHPKNQVSLCNFAGTELVDQFLTLYFKLYDNNRRALQRAYKNNVLISLVCNQLVEKNDSRANSRLNCYHMHCKNILSKKESDQYRNIFFKTGSDAVEFLCSLPATKHDIFSFKIDLIAHSDTMSIIMVCGVFQELLTTEVKRSFSRTFVLHKVAEDEYKIANELFQISKATEQEVKDSSIHQPTHYRKIKTFLNQTEQKEQIDLLAKVTSMNTTYAKKYLQCVDWNMKKALELFQEDYNAFRIPPEALLEIPLSEIKNMS